MKIIELTKGKTTVVDDEDYDVLARHRWHFARGRYAARRVSVSEHPDRVLLYMHRQIVMPADGMEVDHIDGDCLNNRRSNLRVCTVAQNRQNKGLTRGRRYKGITRNLQGAGWRAQIKVERKEIILGVFLDEETAARAYDKAALRYFGEYARLNFPL